MGMVAIAIGKKHMNESLFSPYWYRVKTLTPQLRKHVEVHRHDYRGLIWFILEDKSSGRHHRFNNTAFRIIGFLDGKRTINEVWELANEQLGDFAPTQPEMIELLSQLHKADLLSLNIAVDTDELFQRQEDHKSFNIKQSLMNPISQKFPLWDPEDFLERNLVKVRWLFNWLTATVWLSIVVLAVLLASMNWQAISYHFQLNSLSPNNLIILFVIYPIVKFIHELGHAFTAKMEGAEVHEMGIIFVLFFPIPYVNVSSVTNCRNKYKRILVSTAGIIVELFIAASALFVWVATEPGVLNDIAYNIMIIGGVSSIFFNGNPLLKYDGYYILADMIDIPNLFQRSTKYLQYICHKFIFGAKNITNPAHTTGESIWFVFYGITSFLYRIGILWVIIVYITKKYLLIGIILAIWMILSQFIMPFLSLLNFIATNSSLRARKIRVISCLGVVISILLSIIFMFPFPSYTMSEGVVWLPENSQLKAESSGFSGSLLINLNGRIKKGITVVQLEDSFVDTKVKIQEAKLSELEANYRAEKFKDLVKAQITKEKITAVESELELAKKEMDSMLIKTKTHGHLLIPDADDLAGKYIKKGDMVGYVLDNSLPIVRTLVTQKDIGKLRAGITSIQVRLSNQISSILPAKLVREIPEATNYLPSAALSSIAGGTMIVDPNRKDELITLEKFFLVDVEFKPTEPNLFIGTRAYVKFYHGHEVLARQWIRVIRQIFLRSFYV